MGHHDGVEALTDHLTLHAVACAVATLITYHIARYRLPDTLAADYPLLSAIGLALSLGVVKEVGDWLQLWPWCERRKCEWDEKDLLWDAVGVWFALGLLALLL
ncbi:MAG: hypothetical protein SGPRY_003394, partial [Prymnesium sp.]